MSRVGWPYAMLIRTQLENAARRCAREVREGAITDAQADAILTPLYQAIAAAVLAEKEPPEPRPQPGIEIHGRLPVAEPEPAPAAPPPPEATAWPFGIYGLPYAGQ